MAQVRVDPMKPLTELEKIIAQVEAAKDVDREARQLSKMWEGIGARFDEALLAATADVLDQDSVANPRYIGLGIDPGKFAQAGETARKVAELLNPIADVSWTKEQVEELLVGVRFFLISQFYEGEAIDRAQSAVEKAGTLTKTRVTAGTRGVAPVVEGRPAVVEVWLEDGSERVSSQKGNSENSPGNILKSVTGWLERRDIEVTDEMKDQIAKSIKQCVIDGQAEVAIGDFAVIRHA